MPFHTSAPQILEANLGWNKLPKIKRWAQCKNQCNSKFTLFSQSETQDHQLKHTLDARLNQLLNVLQELADFPKEHNGEMDSAFELIKQICFYFSHFFCFFFTVMKFSLKKQSWPWTSHLTQRCEEMLCICSRVTKQTMELWVIAARGSNSDWLFSQYVPGVPLQLIGGLLCMLEVESVIWLMRLQRFRVSVW